MGRRLTLTVSCHTSKDCFSLASPIAVSYVAGRSPMERCIWLGCRLKLTTPCHPSKDGFSLASLIAVS